MQDKRIKNFTDKISATLLGIPNYGIELHFYLTSRCNLACPGCYANASPKSPDDTLPADDVLHYVRAFKKEPLFQNAVAFSGGEIFTRPLNYLMPLVQSTLDCDVALELKTNGAWVADAKKSELIFQMLTDLNVKKNLYTTDAEMERIVRSIPDAKTIPRDKLYEMVKSQMTSVPMLSMAVSVDNIIHPAHSANWFVDIAQRVTNEPKLYDNIALKAVSFNDAQRFFGEKVLLDDRMNITNFEYEQNGYSFKVNNQRIEWFVSNFIDTKQPTVPESLADIFIPSVSGDGNRLVLFFYPDRTVSVETPDLKPIGRVSYIDKMGKYKSFGALRMEIAQKLVNEYAALVK